MDTQIKDGIKLLLVAAIIMTPVVFLMWAAIQSPPLPSPYIPKELEFATDRVIQYWQEKEPNSQPDREKIMDAIRKVATYRKVSYDRAADLIILAFKTGEPDIIEFIR